MLANLAGVAQDAAMAGDYKQMPHGDGEAARKLRERIARREMGAAAYDKAASYADDRAFKRFVRP
jgi:hypothetical protein